jgi:hypothetical protein
VGKPRGQAHLSNTGWGKRKLATYDGHAREPGASKDLKRARWRRRRRKERQTFNQIRDDIEALERVRRRSGDMIRTITEAWTFERRAHGDER